ncbi:MAG: type 4a pilus biogenesis protein PilO [Pseudomonadales bacterium]|jgi:type IV pilus assembly protein PilO
MKMIEEMKDFRAEDLDLTQSGQWPVLVKMIFWAFLFAVILAAGWWFVIKGKQTQLQTEVAKEATLKTQFESKAFQVANLPALRQQMVDMEAQFGALLRQLPSDTEVPGLLEDITSTGVGAGLEFDSINLQPEIQREYYIELPIQISVRGSYHELGGFVSGVAGLPRIVTLHDFQIQPVGGDQLDMNILAKTYRYRDDS